VFPQNFLCALHLTRVDEHGGESPHVTGILWLGLDELFQEIDRRKEFFSLLVFS
jgi:hypothetical protein